MDSQFRKPSTAHMLGCLALVVLALLISACAKGETSGAGSTLLPVPSPRPFLAVHVCFDTPPWYPTSLAHQAAVGIANSIDASVSVERGSSGLLFTSSFITSHSYENDTGVSFAIPTLPLPVAPSPPQYTSDPYQNSLLRQQYHQAVAVWQEAMRQVTRQLQDLQGHVHAQTNKLRSLTFPIDATGSDVLSCLLEASNHLEKIAGDRLLLLASDLVNLTPQREIGSFSLTGITVKAIYHTCIGTPEACQQRDSAWRHFLLHAGATSVTFFDPSESSAQPGTITF